MKRIRTLRMVRLLLVLCAAMALASAAVPSAVAMPGGRGATADRRGCAMPGSAFLGGWTAGSGCGSCLLAEPTDDRLRVDRVPAGIGSRTDTAVTSSRAAYPLADTFKLHSLPGAKKTILLDFGPRTLSNTYWTAKQVLFGVSPVSANDVWAVGWGTILHFNGATWTSVSSPTGKVIYDVDMVSSTDGWAVGEDGTCLRYAGGNWITQTSPALAAMVRQSLYSLDMVSATDGWAVGDDGTILRYDGSQWTKQSSPTTKQLRGIDMVDSSTGWAVGVDGTILSCVGGSWNLQATFPGTGLHDVQMLNASEGWAVGGGAPGVSAGSVFHYSGGTWAPQTSSVSYLVSVGVISSTEGYGVGPSAIVRYNGSGWSSTGSTTEQLNRVRMLSASDGWAVGTNGTILRPQGGSWVSQATPGGEPRLYPAWTIDADPAFNDAEKAIIQDVWQRVAEDYAPFGVDVTTEFTTEDAITRSSAADDVYGMRILIGPGVGGGVARFNAFDEIGDYNKPAHVTTGVDPIAIANVASHECGHTFGLDHDGTPTEDYYPGSGSGETGWAPLMGGFARQLTQWSKGEYPGASNQEDDLAIMADHMGSRPDEAGDTIATAATLPSSAPITASGFITSATDVDVYRLQSTGGPLTIDVKPAPVGPNLDVLAEVRDAQGAVLASSNPPEKLAAQIGVTLPAGSYYLFVRGTGKGSPLDVGGYSNYASLGQYSVSVVPGSVTPPAPQLAWTMLTTVRRAAVDVSMISANDGWTVGNNAGYLMHYDGVSWTRQPSPTTQSLWGIDMVSATEGWAVGAGGTILHYARGAWATQPCPTTKDLADVDMVSASEGWAVGADGVILRYAGGVWTLLPTVTTQPLRGIEMLNASEGWVVGSSGTILRCANGAWSVQSSPTSSHLQSVSSVASNDAWAVGYYGEILHYDGSAWTKQLSPTNQTLNRVCMVAATDGWAGASDGSILRYVNGAWTPQPTATNQSVNGIDMVNASDGWMVCSYGVLLHFENGAWVSKQSNTLKDVEQVSRSDAWIVGGAGTIMRWDGSAWIAQSSPATQTLENLNMVGPIDGWAVGAGGTILRFDGMAWAKHKSPTSERLICVDMVSATDGWAVGTGGTILHYAAGTWTAVASPTTQILRSVSMISANEGWAVGEGATILRYANGAWTPQSNPAGRPIVSVLAVSAADVWAVCTGGTILHYDGTAWTLQSSPTGEQLNRVDLSSASDGWAVGLNGAMIRYSSGSWSSVAGPWAGTLIGLDMVSPTEGWAVGENGAIERYSLPSTATPTATTVSGPKTARAYRTLKLSGTVTPSAPGTVSIRKMRLSGSRWIVAGTARVSVVGGRFDHNFKPTKRGSWRFVAEYSGGVLAATAHLPSRSTIWGVTVR